MKVSHSNKRGVNPSLKQFLNDVFPFAQISRLPPTYFYSSGNKKSRELRLSHLSIMYAERVFQPGLQDMGKI
jgi:hypothetical protein